jgi:hypothetical protein
MWLVSHLSSVTGVISQSVTEDQTSQRDRKLFHSRSVFRGRPVPAKIALEKELRPGRLGVAAESL